MVTALDAATKSCQMKTCCHTNLKGIMVTNHVGDHIVVSKVD